MHVVHCLELFYCISEAEEKKKKKKSLPARQSPGLLAGPSLMRHGMVRGGAPEAQGSRPGTEDSVDLSGRNREGFGMRILLFILIGNLLFIY